jgi:hypothetical protein
VIEVGDFVRHPTLGRRRVVAADPHSASLQGQRVCMEVYTDDNLWGGWVWVSDHPGSLSTVALQRNEQT